ncbi:MAG: hypothetical protein KDA96_26400, partial [Planctomycetaceae bacterium]|nr:hypothetical protein [Planctomycetaceae bacterium]
MTGSPITSPPSDPRRKTALCLIPLVICLFFLGRTILGERTARKQLVISDLTTMPGDWADENSCVECHEQGETFWATGHAKTLSRATQPDSAARLLKIAMSPRPTSEMTSVRAEGDHLLAVHHTSEQIREVALDWCFGSGTHAQTWTCTMPEADGTLSQMEFRWTWYREIDGFDLTPGQAETASPGFFHGLGVLFDSPRTGRCFSCHTSRLPVVHGQIQEDQIHMGVTCQRCHGPRQPHVASDGAIVNPEWRGIDRDDSVQRCAQCHRLPEQNPRNQLHPDNPGIVRFQPIGLMKSACYLNSDMSCITCHDPHKTMKQQDSAGIWQCLQCHNPDNQRHTTCQAGETENCLECHMPRVPIDAPVAFTDHWIRIRQTPPAEQAARNSGNPDMDARGGQERSGEASTPRDEVSQ